MKLSILASSLFVLQANASLWNSTIGSLSRIFTSQVEEPAPATEHEPVHEDDFALMDVDAEKVPAPSNPRINSLESKSFEMEDSQLDTDRPDMSQEILKFNEENGLHLAPSTLELINEGSYTENNFVFYTKLGLIFYQHSHFSKEIPVAPFYPGVPLWMSVRGAQALLEDFRTTDLETLKAASMAKLRQEN